MKKETYKVDHPLIKEIYMGDKFLLNNGEIVTFVKYTEDTIFHYIMSNRRSYTKRLTAWVYNVEAPEDIKYKLPSLKQKIDLL